MRKMTLVVGLVVSSAAVSLAVSGIEAKLLRADEDSVVINEKNFPDPVFRAKVATFDKDGDGVLSYTERNVTKISITNTDLASVVGIEYFYKLSTLELDHNKLTSLDLSKNTKMYDLRCAYNQLESVNLQGLTNLSLLTLNNNKLKSIDLTSNTRLYQLRLWGNQLESIDLSKNNELSVCYISDNSFTKLDFSKNSSLRQLQCSSDSVKLTSLNLTGCTCLEEIYCSSGALTQLDLSTNTNLKKLDVQGNQLAKLDFSNNTELTSLACQSNKLTSLTVSKCSKLKSLNCSSNRLPSLSVSGCTSLTDLICGGNCIKSLDVSKKTTLERLSCGGNKNTPSNEKLTSLNLSGATALDYLNCEYSAVSNLDLSDNKALEVLYINGMSFSSLDLSNQTNLYSLYCNHAKISSLNLSNKASFTILECDYAEISTLNLSGAKGFKKLKLPYDGGSLKNVNLSGCTALQEIQLVKVGLGSLNVSGCTSLVKLDCYQNDLKSLDVSTNTSLTYLNCSENYLTSLKLGGASSLVDLDCAGNNLSTLTVSQNKQLKSLSCYGNSIKTLNLNSTPLLNECMSYRSAGTRGSTYHGVQCYAYSYKYPGDSSRYVYVSVNTNVVASNLTPTPTPRPSNTPTPLPQAVASIDEEHFPDPVFRNYVTEKIDKTKDGILDTEEIANTTKINVNTGNTTKIGSLEGIKYFTDLTELGCSGQSLTALDLSGNTKLEVLDCSFNNISALNLSANKNLKKLECYQNALTSINLSSCTGLSAFVKSETRRATGTGHELSDERVCPSYTFGKERETEYYLVYDRFTDLVSTSLTPTPVPPAPASDSIAVNSTNFPDAAFRQYIKEVDMDANRNGALEKSEINTITDLEVEDRGIKSLKGMEYFTNLSFLNCCVNQLTSLDLTNNTKLAQIVCQENQIKTLNVFFCPKLADLVNTTQAFDDGDEFAYWKDVYDEEHGYMTCHFILFDRTTTVSVSKPTVGKPTGVQAVSASSTSVKVSWNAVSGATGYQVWRSTSATGTFTSLGSVTATSRVSTGLTTGTTYYYKVRAYKEIHGTKYYSSFSDVVSATVKVGKPTGVKAVSASATSVTVSWNAVSDATGYQVCRSLSADGTFTVLGTVTSTSRVSTGLTTGTTYYYKVRAYKEVNGTKKYGNYSAVISAVPKPSAPSGVKAVPNTTTSVTVSWNEVSGATGYQVSRSLSSNGTFTALGSVTTTSRVSTNLTSGVTYYYKVRAYKEVNGKRIYGAYSIVVSSLPKPLVPGNVKATVSSATKVTVSWAEVNGVAGYEVWRSESANGTYSRLGAVTTTSRACPGLTTGKTYYFKVRAYVEVDGVKYYSSFSSVVNATTKA